MTIQSNTMLICLLCLYHNPQLLLQHIPISFILSTPVILLHHHYIFHQLLDQVIMFYCNSSKHKHFLMIESSSNIIVPVVVSIITIFITIPIIVIVLVIVGIRAVYFNRKVCYTIYVLFKSQFFLESYTRSSDADLSSIWYKRGVLYGECY